MSQIKLPSELFQSVTICRYELLRLTRGKRIPAILGIAIIVPLLIIIIPELATGKIQGTPADFVSIPLGFFSYFLVIVATLFGSNALISEFHDRTGYSLFTNPITRKSIWFGKFFAAEIIAFVAIAIYYTVMIAATLIKFGELPNEVFFSFGFALIAITTMMSITFLISSFLRGPTAAAVFIFFLFILILPMIDQLLYGVIETKPWFTPTFSAKILENVLIVPYPIDLAPGELPRGPFDIHQFVPYVNDSVFVMTLYSVVSGIISILIYKRKEMI